MTAIMTLVTDTTASTVPATRLVDMRNAPDNWANDPTCVYIGRDLYQTAHDWGNPYLHGNSTAERQASMKSFGDHLHRVLDDNPQGWARIHDELYGKTLVGFSNPDKQPTHGKVLLKAAEQSHERWLQANPTTPPAATNPAATCTVNSDAINDVINQLIKGVTKRQQVLLADQLVDAINADGNTDLTIAS